MYFKNEQTGDAMSKFISSIFILFLFFTACDFEKFYQSKYEATPIPISAKITGQVTDRFSKLPVEDAIVNIGNQATFTNADGDFLLNYILGSDEERNRPVEIKISAYNYLTLNSAEVVYPETNIDFEIDYAAPIIKQICLVDSICQAIVFDNQGFDDISTVKASFAYVPLGEKLPVYYLLESLNSMPTDCTKIGHFQCFVEVEIVENIFISPVYKVEARDKAGFADSTSSTLLGVDTLLFPVF